MTYHDICQRLTPLYGPQEAKAMTRMLLEDLFSLSFADILCGATEHLSDADTLRLQQSVARLLDSEPLQTSPAQPSSAAIPSMLLPAS